MTSRNGPRVEDRGRMDKHRCIEEFAASGENRLNESTLEPAWARPLVGFSRGDDPLYGRIKSDIRPFYWTPRDAFGSTFPSSDASDEDLAVISWIFPHTDRTKADSRKEGSIPRRGGPAQEIR